MASNRGSNSSISGPLPLSAPSSLSASSPWRRRSSRFSSREEIGMFDRVRLLLTLRRLAICAVLVVALAPVVWLFSIAYKPTRDIFASPPTFLFTPTLDNFESVFRYFKLGALLESSLIIAIGSTALSLLLGSPAGYALARSESPRAIWLAY